MLSYTILAKVVSLVAYAVLGWFLLERDFKLVALATAAATFPAILQQIGIREVLIQNHADFPRWANSAFWLSGLIGLATAVLTAAAAPLTARIYGEPRLIPLTLVLAASTPFNSLAVVPLAKLQFAMRHRVVASVGSALALAGPALSVLLAWLKCGPYALLVPLALTSVARFLLLWIASGFVPRLAPDRALWRPLLVTGFQLLVARAMGLIIAQGDYILLGYFYRDRDDVLGIYYFAFNLSMQTVSLLVPNLDGVLLPTLTRLHGEPERQRASFLLAARTLALLAFPVCFLQAALADSGVRALLAERWIPAIPVIQILSVGMAFRTAGWIIHSLIPAQGRWGVYSALHAAGAAGFVTCVVAGALLGRHFLGGAPAVAVAVALYFAIEAPLVLYVAMRPMRGTWGEIAHILVRPILLAAAGVGVASFVGRLIPPTPLGHWLRLLVIPLLTLAALAPLTPWVVPDLWHSLRLRLAILLNRRQPV